MRVFKNKLNQTKIRTKILVAYVLVVIVCLVIALLSFKEINNNMIEKDIKTLSDEALVSVDKYLETIFDHINEVSNVFFFEPAMQELLKEIDSNEINPKIQGTIINSLTTMALSIDYISSIYIFDNYDNYYFSHYKPDEFYVSDSDVKTASWYKEVESLNGGMAIVPNCDGFIGSTKKSETFISLIRNILSLDGYEVLGTLIINVDSSKLQTYLKEISLTGMGDYFITDANYEYIVAPSNNQAILDEYIHQQDNELTENDFVNIDGKQYYLASIPSRIDDWVIHSLIPLTSFNDNYAVTTLAVITIILLLFSVILYVLLTTTKWIFNPLQILLDHMRDIEDGNFNLIPMDKEKDNEITALKRGFNEMITAISHLIEKIENEQNIIRKNELDIIQAQVKPHFLYNTLDAINALTLMGENEDVSKMISALGTFYRNSLNSGKDLVTVQEELDCIKSYITILNIRYDHKLTLEIDIEEEMLQLKMLKLLLQPIIENAVYHGVRELTHGHIKVLGYMDEDELIFIVSDNGIGMQPTTIHKVLNNKLKKDKGGFGIYSCIQRISLFYGIKNPITIISEMDFGTEVIIRIKTVEEKSEY